MDRGQPRAGARPAWLIPLIIVGVLIGGALLIGVGLLGWRYLIGPEPVSPPAPGAGESPPSATAPGTGPRVTVDQAVCSVGQPDFRGSGPLAGRLHGGGLGMALPNGLVAGDPGVMPYAFDVAVQQSPDGTTWAGVGAVRVEEHFHTPEQASATVAACLSQAYADSLTVERAEFVDLPGARQSYQRTGTLTDEGTSRDVRVLVADIGSPESFAVYVRVLQPHTAAASAVLSTETGLAGE